ncbi:Mannose-binding lectin [Cordyceps militaris CM01]|uniref:Mannose-binding lectin n=2 Tax=Cordyceps militaris TaxID=73501 RepID=G3JQN1_CORMM|nr:Mannose-binding lectin [Cordyceps militaris CM01]ATY63057.1 Mannose-binding lectin [Cordyceps militaris]EGX89535.1 Mannose-binding lectin [Cordyceps militaris CM01]
MSAPREDVVNPDSEVVPIGHDTENERNVVVNPDSDHDPSGIQVLSTVVNPQGGAVNQGTTFFIRNELRAAHTVTVWVGRSASHLDRDLILAIRVEWSDGRHQTSGDQVTSSTQHSFRFDEGETVTSMSIWAGDRVDRIRWRTNRNRNFDEGGKNYQNGFGGRERVQNVGNGVLLGFHGRDTPNTLFSLGSIFRGPN